MYIKYNAYINELVIVDNNDGLYSGVYICDSIEEFVSYVRDISSAYYIIKDGLESFKAELKDESFLKQISNPLVGVHPSIIGWMNNLIDEKL